MTAEETQVEAWLAEAGRRLDRGDVAGAVALAEAAVVEQPRSAAVRNMRGVLYVRADRPIEAVADLEQACALDPTDPEPLRNLVDLHLSRHAWAGAAAAATRLLALRPRDALVHHRLAAAAAGERRFQAAEGRLRVALSLDAGLVDAWVDLAHILEIDRPEAAVPAADAGLKANPGQPRLVALRQDLGEMAAAVLAQQAAPEDPAKAARRLELALGRLKAVQDFGGSPGRSEGLALQAANDAIVAALDAGVAPEALPRTAVPIALRLLDRDTADRIADFETLGRLAAETGDSGNLLLQLPRAEPTRAGRLALLAQHRAWGEGVEARATASPVIAPRLPGGKIRLGLVSSDLRGHVVGVFAWPLFEHLDRDRFELYAYSFFPGPADENQKALAGLSTVFRHEPAFDLERAAALIAADGLDMLFEFGGSTGFNKIALMAHRLAPIQASWMGYPHSLGLSTIDYMLVDPYLAPPDPALMMERPLVAPKSFITMGAHHFGEEPPVAPAPHQRNGFVTFGTANAPYKYSPACLELWARTVAATPDSRFLFVRPESDAPGFRDRALTLFARHGVGPERVRFEAVRGAHLPLYGEMDISLDTIPLTGGTTTCESLWMGVPVVSLVGEALHERLSYSILANAGLADLAVDSEAAYVAAATRLAADPGRLNTLRRDLRTMIRTGPMGDPKGFAQDFYDLVANVVAARTTGSSPDPQG